MRLTTCFRLPARATRRKVSLCMLLTLLLLQVQMSLAGCLMPAPAQDPTAIADASADCHSTDTTSARTCLRHCAQSAESPASSPDRSASLAGDLPFIQRTADESYRATVSTSTPHRIDPPPEHGPPVYLRLSRLLD